MSNAITDKQKDGRSYIVWFRNASINPFNNELAHWDADLGKWVNHLGHVLLIDPASWDPVPADLQYEDEYVGGDKLPFYLTTREEYLARGDGE